MNKSALSSRWRKHGTISVGSHKISAADSLGTREIMQNGHENAGQVAAVQEMRTNFKVNIQRAFRSATEDKHDFAHSGVVSLKSSRGDLPALSLRETGHISLPLDKKQTGISWSVDADCFLAHMYVCMYLCMYVCMYACMYHAT